MMNRRRFLGSLSAGLLAAARVVEGQQGEKVARVGVLWPGADPPGSPRMDWLRQGLRDQGYVEGQNLVLDVRFASDLERLREHAERMVQAHVNVIVSYGDGGPRAAQRATTHIPIGRSPTMSSAPAS